MRSSCCINERGGIPLLSQVLYLSLGGWREKIGGEQVRDGEIRAIVSQDGEHGWTGRERVL